MMIQAVLGNPNHPEYGGATIPFPIQRDDYDNCINLLKPLEIGEAAQFQAMEHDWRLSDLKDLINLTFFCHQATVIMDFSDLNKVGREHYMNLHGGSAPVVELENLDGEETARLLIASGNGVITPYGVVYDNGMELEQVYDGTHFPCYYYEQKPLVVAMTSRHEPEDTENITWLHLPLSAEQLSRTQRPKLHWTASAGQQISSSPTAHPQA